MKLDGFDFQRAVVFDGGLTDFDGLADVDTCTREAVITSLVITATGDSVEPSALPARTRAELEAAALDAAEEEIYR